VNCDGDPLFIHSFVSAFVYVFPLNYQYRERLLVAVYVVFVCNHVTVCFPPVVFVVIESVMSWLFFMIHFTILRHVFISPLLFHFFRSYGLLVSICYFLDLLFIFVNKW